MARLAVDRPGSGPRGPAYARYEQLAGLGDTPAEEMPAGLLARYGRCLVLRELGRTEDLHREAGAKSRRLPRGKKGAAAGALRYLPPFDAGRKFSITHTSFALFPDVKTIRRPAG